MVKYNRYTSTSFKMLTQNNNALIFDLEFDDLAHIPQLSADTFSIIKEFCGKLYYPDLTKYTPMQKFEIGCIFGLHTIIGTIFERDDVIRIFKGRAQKGYYSRYRYNGFNMIRDVSILNWIKNTIPRNYIVRALNHSSNGLFVKARHESNTEVLDWITENFSEV